MTGVHRHDWLFMLIFNAHIIPCFSIIWKGARNQELEKGTQALL
jgi:hypothetical protein